MDIQSLFSLFIFVFFLSAISVIGFSYTYLFFSSIPDRGWAFTKLITILFLSYSAWLIGHAGPFYNFLIILAIFLLITFISILIYYKKWKPIFSFIKKSRRLLIFEELIFFAFFTFFLIIRIGNPDLWHPVMGGEKPMDVAFINAILRTNTLPPYDPWLTGYTINYYYFGQFITATLAKLLSIPTSIFYNLFIAYLFGQAVSLSVLIVYSFTKSRLAGILGGIFLIISGNLAQIPVIIDSFKILPPINGWYWTASRVMPNHEINEFPFFTFLYADLHSHLIALPIALFFIILIVEIFNLLSEGLFRKSLIPLIIASIVLGIIRITNIWDYPTYLLIGSFMLSLFIFVKEKSIKRKLLLPLLPPSILFAVSHVSIIPFLLHYKTGELGVGIYEGPSTLISDYLIIHGLFLFINLVFLILIIKPKNVLPSKRLLRLVAYIPFMLTIILGSLGLYFLGFLSGLLFISLFVFITNPKRKYIIPISLFLVAIFLTAIPDLIDIKLGLGRMNTVFKFYFQAWVFFALSSAIAIFYIYKEIKKLIVVRIILLITFLCVFLGTLSYPLTAAPAKIIDRMGTDRTPTLNGMHFMKTSVYPEQDQMINLYDDLKAINWINENIYDSEIIVEANTPLYRWGGRVSIYTGLPTILGWDWHEIAHRQYMLPQEIQQRAEHIRQIYESTNFDDTKQYLVLYNVSYIYLGQLEKAYYNIDGIIDVIKNNPDAFDNVYTGPNVNIYKFLDGKHY